MVFLHSAYFYSANYYIMDNSLPRIKIISEVRCFKNTKTTKNNILKLYLKVLTFKSLRKKKV